MLEYKSRKEEATEAEGSEGFREIEALQIRDEVSSVQERVLRHESSRVERILELWNSSQNLNRRVHVARIACRQADQLSAAEGAPVMCSPKFCKPTGYAT